MYDCEACAIRQQLADLDAANRTAWQAWQRIAHRLVVDLHAGGFVLGLALQEMDPDDALTCVERLAVIYDVLNPPRTPTTD